MNHPLQYKDLSSVLDRHPTMSPFVRSCIERGNTMFTDIEGESYALAGSHAHGMLTKDVVPAALVTKAPAPATPRTSAIHAAAMKAADASVSESTAAEVATSLIKTRAHEEPPAVTTTPKAHKAPTSKNFPALNKLALDIEKEFEL